MSPAWRRDGRELFYQTAAGLMAVEVSPGPQIQFGPPRQLFAGNFFRDSREDGPRAYDVAPDGKRFLMVKSTPRQGRGPPYRCSSTGPRSRGEVPIIRPREPARTEPGSAFIELHPDGRLVRFETVPLAAEPAGDTPLEADWSRLFSEAGLDLRVFTTATPGRLPPVYADVRAA